MARSFDFKAVIETFGENAAAALRQVMEEEAEAIVRDMKSRAPVKSGALRDSIRWKWNRNKTKITIIADAANDKGYKYDRIVEFSPKINKPFFYPAVDAHREEYRAKLIEALRREARKAGK